MSLVKSAKAFMIIGGAQAINLVISIVRVKVIAVLMGPSGIGMLGLFNSVRDSVINIANLGIPNSGVKTLSQETRESKKFAEIQGAIVTSLFLQGAFSFLIFWIMEDQLNSYIFDSTLEKWQLVAIGCAIWIALSNFAILTILQAQRRVSEIAKVDVVGSLIGSSLGLFFVVAHGEKALALFVLCLAIGQMIAAGGLILKVKDIFIVRFTTFKIILQHWIKMSRLGISLMFSGMALTLTMLLMRSYVQKEAGLEAVGQFEAAWVLSITLVAVFLNTMAADYFPKLSSIINDNLKVHQTVNDHIQLILVLTGPMLIIMIGLAPWLIDLLYSQEFIDSQIILQWFMVGNYFKLICLSFSYILLAKSYGRLYLLLEIILSVCLALFSWLQFSDLSVVAIGPAFVSAYAIQACLLYLCIFKLVQFKLATRTIVSMSYNLVAITIVMSAAQYSYVLGVCVALLFFLIGLLIGFKFFISGIDSNNAFVARLNRFLNKT